MLQLSSLPCRAKGANCKNTNRTPRTPSIDLRVQWIPPSLLKLPWSFGSSHHEPPQRPRGHYYLSRFIIHSSIGGRRHRPIRPADLSASRLKRLQKKQKRSVFSILHTRHVCTCTCTCTASFLGSKGGAILHAPFPPSLALSSTSVPHTLC